MNNFRGGLLAGVATAAIAGAIDPSICSIDDGGDGGGGGGSGAAALLDDPAPDGGGDGGTGGAGGDGGDAPEVADWMKGFSAEKPGDGQLSNQEWLAKIGAKDPDDLVTRYRAAERGLRESGKVKIPGENATEEERAAFRDAIGAPKEAKGYEITMPEGAENYEIDTAVIDPLREAAFKHGVPAAAFKEMADVFMAAALEDAKAEVARTDSEAADQIKKWGADAPRRKEEFRRGAELLGLTKADIADIQREYGGGRTLELFAKIGQLAGEDFFGGNGGNLQQRFGVGSLEEAEKQLRAMTDDKEVAAKIRAKDPATLEKYRRLTDAVAGFREQAARKR